MELENAIDALAVPLLRYCLGKTGSPELAEDVAQEALTALVQRWRRYGAPEDPAAFAFTVARRRAGRWLARRALSRPLDLLRDRPSPMPDPAEIAQRRGQTALAAAVIKKLPAKEREILLLVAAGELQVQQAADLCGISLSAAKMRLHRARRRLASQMENEHELAGPRPAPFAG